MLDAGALACFVQAVEPVQVEGQPAAEGRLEDGDIQAEAGGLSCACEPGESLADHDQVMLRHQAVSPCGPADSISPSMSLKSLPIRRRSPKRCVMPSRSSSSKYWIVRRRPVPMASRNSPARKWPSSCCCATRTALAATSASVSRSTKRLELSCRIS